MIETRSHSFVLFRRDIEFVWADIIWYPASRATLSTNQRWSSRSRARWLVGRENLTSGFVWEDISIFVIQVLYREGWIIFQLITMVRLLVFPFLIEMLTRSMVFRYWYSLYSINCFWERNPRNLIKTSFLIGRTNLEGKISQNLL